MLFQRVFILGRNERMAFLLSIITNYSLAFYTNNFNVKKKFLLLEGSREALE